MIISVNISELIPDSKWLILVLIPFISGLNYSKYKKYISVFYDDIYIIDGQTNKRIIHRDKEAYIKAIRGFIKMKRSWSLPIGLISTISTILIWNSLKKLDTGKNPADAFEDSNTTSEQYFEKYKAHFKVFDILFPFLYVSIHLTKNGSIWLMLKKD